MSTSNKSLSAGTLRHHVAIDQPVSTQDPITGEMMTVWAEIAVNVPAAVEPLSGREYIAAAQANSSISARIKIRYRPGLNAAMRIRHDAAIYGIKAILPDPNSGKEWLTLLVESQ